MTRSAQMIDSVVKTTTRDILISSDIPEAAITIFSAEGDERSKLAAWESRFRDGNAWAVAVTAVSPETSSITVKTRERVREVNLIAPNEFWAGLPDSSEVVIDISELPVNVWAPLLMDALKKFERVSAVYAEPKEYRLHQAPADVHSIFDLSREIKGIRPIPGFARLAGPSSDVATVLITFLGFEGARARVLASTLDPLPPKVYAVLGLPGFRPDYPGQAFMCNHDFLIECKPEIEYVLASCPFQAMSTLQRIAEDFKDYYIYVAPIGTKPHALGAVLFALYGGQEIELLYDHPVHQKQRTTGISCVHHYRIK